VATLFLAALTSSAEAQPNAWLSINVDDPRPLAEALGQLAERHKIVVTYEDPRYLYAGDVKDVTRTVSRTPTPTHRILIPLGGRLDFNYSVSAATGQPENWDALLASLLEAHAAGGGARFRFERANGATHVFPAESRNASGQWVEVASILDAYITIPEQDLTKAAIVEAVAQTIGDAANVHLGVGTCLDCGPRALGPEPTERFGVANERARDVLWRVVQHWRRGSSWRIFQDPGSDLYVLNVTFAPVRDEPVLASPPEPTVRQGADGAPRCTAASARTDCAR
jgi:hypothetical protein